MYNFVLSLIGVLVLASVPSQSFNWNGCHTEDGTPKRCYPEFEDIALNQPIDVTNTCGENGPTKFCDVSTRLSFQRDNEQECQVCTANDSSLAHPAKYLTDLDTAEKPTWWQSETLYELGNNPRVNLTLSLNKAYDITYISLKFHSPRPDSFAIYKRTKVDGPWIPFQYFSQNCSGVYGKPDLGYVDATQSMKETEAMCTSEFSDISPLSGGNVAISTLEGRPSAYSFEKSSDLQEWVTATDIRITLDRPNTFGDEIFREPSVLKSYFYAISEFHVGGKCKCNGHASECVKTSDEVGKLRQSCHCEHNTAGEDCDKCLPFYNDQPWGRATARSANECKACNCNGFSEECFFNQELYNKTGHGGHCVNCKGNRGGPNCESCKDNFFLTPEGDCLPCQCNEIGSKNMQCNKEGACECKLGVSGRNCDVCQPAFFYFAKNKTCYQLMFKQMKLQYD